MDGGNRDLFSTRLTGSATAGANAVTNGDFTGSSTGWTLAGGASYRLDADLHHQGHALGSATVVLDAGAPGRLQVDGDDGYALTLLVQPEGEVIRVEGRLSRPGRGDPAPEPFAMLLRPGAPRNMRTSTMPG